MSESSCSEADLPLTTVLLTDFFASRTWTITRAGLIAAGVVFWLAVGFWTFKDARRRVRSPWLVALATLLGLVPPYVGALVYMLFRPPEYLDEVRERELEIRAIEERLAAAQRECPVCRAAIEPSFLVCPVCTTRLKEACSGCKAPLEPLWQMCPFCETPVVRASAADLVGALESTIALESTETVSPRGTTRKRPAADE
ncbi:MAG TPA: zinc ribbon domain-containing protein [Gaiellaceae bacterium]|nr:zinc ribbon domain-containing protein [Gaiellaceae bacterium]